MISAHSKCIQDVIYKKPTKNNVFNPPKEIAQEIHLVFCCYRFAEVLIRAKVGNEHNLMDFDGFLIKFTDFFDFFIIFSELYNHEYWSVDNNFGCSEKLQSQFVHFWQ